MEAAEAPVDAEAAEPEAVEADASDGTEPAADETPDGDAVPAASQS